MDRAISYLDPKVGLLGVADFFVPSKYDLPLRQMTWLRRFFWRCVGQPTFAPLSCCSRVMFTCLGDSYHLCLLMCLVKACPSSPCRATFDSDNIDIGPERRNYLDHRLSRVWEMNSEVCAVTPLSWPSLSPHITVFS